MRRRQGDRRRLTAQELVSAVAEAGLDERPDTDALQAFLDDLGYDSLQYIRARYWLRRGRPGGYWWDDPSRPIHGLRSMYPPEREGRRRGLADSSGGAW